MTLEGAKRPSTPGSAPVQTRLLRSLDEMADIYTIRRAVFVREQGLTSSVYDDPDDRYSIHVLASIDGQVVGTGRVTYYGDEAQIAWVAVLEPFRGRGVGWAVMKHLLRESREHGSRSVTLNAQTHALSFYRALGFRPIGRTFIMSGIEHQHMILEWSQP